MKKKEIEVEYYIENDYKDLAGPYDPSVKRHREWMASVIEDLDAGDIDYIIIDVKSTRKINGVDVIKHQKMIQRRGMILPKR